MDPGIQPRPYGEPYEIVGRKGGEIITEERQQGLDTNIPPICSLFNHSVDSLKSGVCRGVPSVSRMGSRDMVIHRTKTDGQGE